MRSAANPVRSACRNETWTLFMVVGPANSGHRWCRRHRHGADSRAARRL